MICNNCPRKCNVDRKHYVGFCGVKEKVKISKVMMHKYEEPIISGEKGKSGAIFFAGCNLKCVYCQNYPISKKLKGKYISIKKLARIFKRLESKGAYNINLVTPNHYVEQFISALKIYKPNIPIVWNTSGYESLKSLEKVKNYVDIYITDLKFIDDNIGKKYSNVNDYSKVSQQAIKKMKEYQPCDIIENGLMKKGLIIRHLVLPNHTSDSLRCLDFIKENLGEDSIVSIMSQYEPRYKAKDYQEINRKITPLEYKRVVNHALKLNLNNSYIQDLSSANKKYTPKF